MFRPRHPLPRPGFSCPCRCWALARRLSLIPACHPLIPACHPERSEGSAFLRPVRLPIRSPLVPNHEPQIANSFRIRTSAKRACNFFRIRTSKTRHLKSFRIRTYEKTPGGEGSHLSSQKPPLPAKSLSLPRYFVTSLLHLSLHGTNAPLARLHRCRGEIHA